MLDKIVTVLTEFNTVSVFFRLFLAVLFGGVIGIERGIKRRPAGLRTYMLVCLGAALVMVTNEFINHNFNLSDPARMGAQVISGIGFLGAGTIIVTRHHQVKGLTTAAGLWACSCMGLAIGIGFYQGAVAGLVLIIIIIAFMHSLDNKVVTSSKSLELYVEFHKEGKISEFLSFATAQGIRVSYVEFVPAKYSDQGYIAILASLRLTRRRPHIEIIELLYEVGGVKYLEEV